MHCYMGVDIGTSGCKAVVFDENGEQLSTAYRAYDILSEKEGWAELDPEEVVEKCFQVIRESAATVTPSTVTGIGICSQGEAFTIIDKSGKALCNAFVSSDARAKSIADAWGKSFGEEKLYQITGHTPHPIFTLFKLLWVKENMPEVWSKAHRVLCFEDLLQFRLGISTPAISWSLAGRTMLFDVVNHCWSKEIINAAKIKQAWLSNPLPSGKIAGCVAKDISQKLKLPEQTFVVTGGHDQPCSALGAGVTDEGMAVYATGTVECITPVFHRPVFKDLLKKSNLCTYDYSIEGLYATVAFNLTGGNILQWFRNEFGGIETQIAKNTGRDVYDLLLELFPEKPSGLLVLPYFTSSGTPYFDTNAKGVIMGLDFNTSRGEIIKALLEGVAFEMRLNLEILENSGYKINQLRVIGGGAKSKVWNQLKADVLGKLVVVPKITEAGCLGTAILVRAAHTREKAANIASNWVKADAAFYPQKMDEYALKYCLYKKLYPVLKGNFF